MRKYVTIVWCVLMWLCPSDNFRTQEMGLLMGNSVYGVTTLKTDQEITQAATASYDVQFTNTVSTKAHHADDPEPPDRHYPVIHAGLPRDLAAYALPLENSYHELHLNVSWTPSHGSPAKDYSLEVRTTTDTEDCQSSMCYEYNIPGDRTWWFIPQFSSPVVDSCAIRPGCAYMVRLIAHPWDGHTSANIPVELNECEANVCSCAHSLRLPKPVVNAQTVLIQEEMFVNVTWSLQPPQYPQRLPRGLKKQHYMISVGKQMVSDAHPAPWFPNTISRYMDTDGMVTEGDSTKWLVLPISERSIAPRAQNGQQGSEQSDEFDKRRKLNRIAPGVKLFARVNLIDDRGCIGPQGNTSAITPDAKSSNLWLGSYALLIGFGAAWAMGAVFLLSARYIKGVLKSFRRPPVSPPLDRQNPRPLFPLQQRT